MDKMEWRKKKREEDFGDINPFSLLHVYQKKNQDKSSQFRIAIKNREQFRKEELFCALLFVVDNDR